MDSDSGSKNSKPGEAMKGGKREEKGGKKDESAKPQAGIGSRVLRGSGIVGPDQLCPAATTFA